MKLLQRHIELCVATASALLIWLIAVEATPAGADRWRTAAIAALTCLGLSALTIRLVRRRRQESRQFRLREAQNRLHEIIVHERAVSALAERVPPEVRPELKAACLAVAHAVTAASDTLQAIAEDRLTPRPDPTGRDRPLR